MYQTDDGGGKNFFVTQNSTKLTKFYFLARLKITVVTTGIYNLYDRTYKLIFV